jgi:GDPmannose 4,6-dehydratase
VNIFIGGIYSRNQCLGTLRLLEAIRTLGLEKENKSFSASQGIYSEMHLISPQNENTPHSPQTLRRVPTVSLLVVRKLCEAICRVLPATDPVYTNPNKTRSFCYEKNYRAAVKIKKGHQTSHLGPECKRDWVCRDYDEACGLCCSR